MILLEGRSDPVPFAERFWAKVDKTGDCWLWTAAIGPRDGYGRFWAHGALRQAHRVAYELVRGPIAPGLQLDHLCRVRSCVRPDHLEPVTNRENFLRGAAPTAVVVRSNTCSYGHELTAANTYVRPDNQRRQCRECNRRRDREKYARQEAAR